MTTSITLRATKGSALTHNEVDDNFSNLKTTADAALPTASLGTNVATALAVNVGSAGAIVVNGGALGTPSSGTLTNATGLPAAGVVGTAAILGANTYTDTQTIALGSLTADKNALSITATWTNGATYTGALLINVTDTSSNALSELADFKVGGTSKFRVRKDGSLFLGNTTVFNSSQTLTCPIATFSTSFGLTVGGNAHYLASSLKFAAADSAYIGWSSGVASSTLDTAFYRNAAGVIEANNGTAGTYRDLKLRTLINSGSANTAYWTGTGYSLTGSDATGMIDLAGTWNTSGTPTAIKLNMADTASNAASLLMDLQVGGASKFKVDKAGVITPTGIALNKIGTNSSVAGSNEFAGGNNANASGGYSLALGQGAVSSGLASVAIGYASSSGHTASVALGEQATTTAANQLRIGSLAASNNHIANISQVAGTNGQIFDIQTLTELLTIAAAATSTTTIQIPAGAIVVAVSVRNTVAVTCTSVYEVGDGTTANKFNTASVSKAVNSTDKGTKAGTVYYAAATSIVITPDTVPSDATGRVRVTIHYLAITPPTS